MQELLGRISRLDPSASLGLRVIACFDELVVGNVNTRGLLAAAASLTGCPAGFRQEHPPRVVRVTPRGTLHDGEPPAVAPEFMAPASDGLTVWLEREGEALPNDTITLERLALAIRIRHGRGRRDQDNRRHLGLLTDTDVAAEDRIAAAAELGLTATGRYRVAAAPLFAVWLRHPDGPEDVIPTRHGPIHAIVLHESYDAFDASPCGVGVATSVDELHHSFRTAMVALRLCSPPEDGLVCSDVYGGLVDMLADTPEDGHQPDVERMDEIVAHPWGLATVGAIVTTHSVREAARQAGVHHSTMSTRMDVISATLGFDPLDGFGRARLGLAYLSHRLRRSRVLDLPAPPVGT
ncbi:helix-turn-helix domain-containing protein [Nocardioides sp.]|uniref:helix-turn-helix domain-containing protein n=1 Tax=Nocardioides sp. TaxID=35761 RepID=UPI00286E1342|nr:helix-turn-helix domain-containing protein [Nocardioides sp.]